MTDSRSYLSRLEPKSTIDTLEIGIRTPQAEIAKKIKMAEEVIDGTDDVPGLP